MGVVTARFGALAAERPLTASPKLREAVAIHESPWQFVPHPLAWAAVAAIGTLYVLSATRLRRGHPDRRRPTPKQVAAFTAGWLALVVATTWPVADLAQRWSLTARIGQQVLLVLVAPPLLLLGSPRWLLATLTRPRIVDAVVRTLTAPAVATAVFCVTVVGALLTPVVAASASSSLGHALVEVALFGAGVVLWLPVVRVVPGTRNLSPAGRVGYLFVQSLLPNFPALLFIFAQHPFYPVYAHHAPLLGISALADQQIAGVVAKLAGIGILWGSAAIVWSQAARAERAGRDLDPLTWDDVERELRRADRRPRRPEDAR